MENFQQRLLKAKELSGLRWIEIAKKSKLDKAQISQYKNGVHIPEPSALYKLSTTLNVSMEWLTGADVNTASDNQVLNRYHQLNDAGKAEFIRLLNNLLSDEAFQP